MTTKVKYVVQVLDEKGRVVYRETFNTKEAAEIVKRGWNRFGFSVNVEEVRFGDR